MVCHFFLNIILLVSLSGSVWLQILIFHFMFIIEVVVECVLLKKIGVPNILLSSSLLMEWTEEWYY